MVQAPNESVTLMRRRIRDLLTIQKASSSLGSLSYTFIHRLTLPFGMAKPVAEEGAADAGGDFRLNRIPVRNYDLNLFFPLASENAVDRQVDIVIVKPFGLAQDAFFLKT